MLQGSGSLASWSLGLHDPSLFGKGCSVDTHCEQHYLRLIQLLSPSHPVAALEASSHQEQIHSHLPIWQDLRGTFWSQSCDETGVYGPVLCLGRQECLKHLESCLDTAKRAGTRSSHLALLPRGSGMGFDLRQPLVPPENSPLLFILIHEVLGTQRLLPQEFLLDTFLWEIISPDTAWPWLPLTSTQSARPATLHCLPLEALWSVWTPAVQILPVLNSPDLINSGTWGLRHPKSSHQAREHILLDNTGLLPNPGAAVYHCQGEEPLCSTTSCTILRRSWHPWWLRS
jgi:hypothetical protein